MRNSLAFALACSLVAGCASHGIRPKQVTIDKPVTVDVAVPTPCMAAVPKSQYVFLSDIEILSGSGAQQADKLWADHLERRDYEAKLIAAIQACVVAPREKGAR